MIPLLAFLVCLPFAAQSAWPAAESSVFYPARYYPDAPDSADAGPLRLEPGMASGPIPLTARPSGGIVRVRFLSQDDGSPIPGLLVEAAAGRFEAFTRTDPSGTASVTGVPSGEAQVRARPDDPRSVTGAYLDSPAPRAVQVRDGAETDAGTVSLARAARIKALVLRPGGEPWPGLPVSLRAVDDSYRRRSVTGADGRAHFGGLGAGAYLLWADARGTSAISTAWDGSQDTLGSSPIAVLEGDLLGEIVIRTDPGGAITGVVRSRSSGLGLAGLEVRVIPIDGPEPFLSVVTDSIGFYYAPGLPSGSYKIQVPAIRRWFPDAENEQDARAVAVAAPETVYRIDLTGEEPGTCRLHPQDAGAIQGAIRADFDLMPRATIEVRGASDTIRAVVRESGFYLIGCIPAGSYRVAFLPDGAYRTQFHPKTNAPDSAGVITITAGDTTRAVDFEPERGVVIEGFVVEPTGGTALAGIPISARAPGVGRVRTVSDETGSFRIDRLADGTGLPAGEWTVAIDSTVVTTIAPTEALVVALEAERESEGVRLTFRIPRDLSIADWRLERRSGDGRVRIVSEASTHPEGTRARSFIDAGVATECAYRLTVEQAVGGAGDRLLSNWVAVEAARRAPLLVFPSPWNGRSPLTLPFPAMQERGCILYGVDGSRAATLRARGRVVEPPAARPLGSGIYFLRWWESAGQERTERIVVRR